MNKNDFVMEMFSTLNVMVLVSLYEFTRNLHNKWTVQLKMGEFYCM